MLMVVFRIMWIDLRDVAGHVLMLISIDKLRIILMSMLIPAEKPTG